MTTSPEDIVPIQTALISVSDRRGLPELLKALTRRHVRIIATGGTAKPTLSGWDTTFPNRII